MDGLGVNSISECISFLDERNKFVSDRSISFVLDSFLNYKLTNVILKEASIDRDKLYCDLSSEEKNILSKKLVCLSFGITSTNSFENAQSCTGGVSLLEVNDTFESKLVPGLYFTGEILDVVGDCGGYNIGFATLSGIIAGMNAGGNND